jgi:hypothetical protein
MGLVPLQPPLLHQHQDIFEDAIAGEIRNEVKSFDCFCTA